MSVDLARLSVFPQQPTQHPLSPHPVDGHGHTGVGGTSPLTGTTVTSQSFRSNLTASARVRVHNGRLDNGTAVLDKLLNMCAGVRVADFRLLIGVEPDFAFADASYGRCEAFLRSKVHHCVLKR